MINGLVVKYEFIILLKSKGLVLVVNSFFMKKKTARVKLDNKSLTQLQDG